MARQRSWTDEDLRTAVADSLNLFQVCRRLGISPGARTYAQLRRHIERLDINAAHLPTVERPSRSRRAWTDDDLRLAVERSSSFAGVMRQLGYTRSGGMHRYIRGQITRLALDTGHFTGRAWRRGLVGTTTGRRLGLDEILVVDSNYMSGSGLRRKIVRAGLKEDRCEMCGLTTWLGQTLPLELDHINGDPTDNRLENLRILCPNCHALTETWCGRSRSTAPA